MTNNLQPVRRVTFIYGLFLSLSLISGLIISGYSSRNLTTLLLFIPIPLYFIKVTLDKFSSLLYTYKRTPVSPQEFESVSSQFHLQYFLSQTDQTFLITITLAAIAFSLTFYRLSFSLLSP